MDPAAAERRRQRRRIADVDRKRAPRACALCKRRKSKCVPTRSDSLVGAHNKCQRCSTKKLDCKFEEGPFTRVQVSTPPLCQTENQSTTTPGDGTGSFTENVTPENSENLSPASILSQGLSKHVIADQSKRVLWPNILSRLREALSLDPQHIPEEREMVAMQARMIRPKTLQPSELSRIHAAIAAFPPRPVADFLLLVFMKHATDVFFYFDQAQLLADIDEFYTDPHSSLRLDPAFICLAMATFALGSQWTPLERPEGFESSQQKENAEIGRGFSLHAKTLIPDIMERSCLRSVQAPFVLGVYFMPASAIGTSYVFLGLALRKALASDLHLSPEDPAMDEREKEIRSRLWWSIYSLERCTTVKLNRPRSIDTQIITVPFPSHCPALDQAQPFGNLRCQMAYIHLIKILDGIAGLMDGPPESAHLSESKWETDLKAWKRSLPSDWKLDQMRPEDFKYRAVLHLYLNYYYAFITMGKVALVTIVRMKLKQTDCETPSINDNAKILASRCAKAARKTLGLFESLTANRKTTRFSFTDFQGCSIATIVTLVSGILERDSAYDHRVEFGINCLRKMATGNMTAKLGVTFVEAVRSITNEAASKLQLHNTFPRDDLASNPHSGYYQWTEWLTRQDDSERQEWENVAQQEIVANREKSIQDPRSLASSRLSGMANQEMHEDENPTTSLIPHGSSNDSPEHFQSYDILSMLHNDEQSFLMGLTGLDALDFSDLTIQLP